MLQATGLVADNVQVPRTRGLIDPQVSHAERLDVSAYGGEWRHQLVRDVGQELTARAICVFQRSGALLQLSSHLVERARQRRDLVPTCVGCASGEVSAADGTHGRLKVREPPTRRSEDRGCSHGRADGEERKRDEPERGAEVAKGDGQWRGLARHSDNAQDAVVNDDVRVFGLARACRTAKASTAATAAAGSTTSWESALRRRLARRGTGADPIGPPRCVARAQATVRARTHSRSPNPGPIWHGGGSRRHRSPGPPMGRDPRPWTWRPATSAEPLAEESSASRPGQVGRRRNRRLARRRPIPHHDNEAAIRTARSARSDVRIGRRAPASRRGHPTVVRHLRGELGRRPHRKQVRRVPSSTGTPGPETRAAWPRAPRTRRRCASRGCGTRRAQASANL